MPKRYVRRLLDYPFVVVRIECRFCSRYRRSYRLVRLAHRCGPDLPMESLLDLLACPYGRPARLRKHQAFCGVKFADLQVEPIYLLTSREVVGHVYFVGNDNPCAVPPRLSR
ncbi:hypothetical protein GCM10007301_15740 [Azorhizobium oxalatiphilum]|uniref:Uncharacterized protein n=1 Tax=Azorhizobium oxalatiphilum TaxID=980631 RepID=A0A917BW46_9HYPH|nr:hypothetical protein [Azorhizobium oxalatiphilum]GGF56884.1 hypothetical protein GCM10007301_15740 [Azorhizobium oxalatiphilum]